MTVKLKTPSNGSVSLTPQDTASDVVVTVPAGTSTVVTNATLPTQLNASGSAPIYACRAWVNFNGSGVVGIRASGNFSSITRNATGSYDLNLTTAMPDINFSSVVSAYINTAGTKWSNSYITNLSTSSIRIQLIDSGTGTTAGDSAYVQAAIFR